MSDEGKVYIGSLNFETNEETLAEVFGKYGTIEKVDVIRDRDSGESRGFGFVTYVNEDDAKAAIIGMNGKDLEGRTLRVDAAGNKGSRRGSFGGPRGGRGARGGSSGYSGDGGYGGRSYGSRSYSNGERGYGGGRYRSGPGYGNYRDSRSAGGYGDRPANYRDGYDAYPSQE